MKKIGVISDTHLKKPSDLIKEIVSKYFSDVDLIIHAGDMVRLCVLDIFYETGKDIVAVSGNMDYPEVSDRFPLKQSIEIEAVRIGIIHGWADPHGMRARIRKEFNDVDAIIYGHTHQAFSGTEDGVFFFNPGSPTDNRFTKDNSIGIIEINDKEIKGKIIKI
ncbi:MAG: metallophosphoesterase [Thermodesulfobacteriota bacterium]|nr:metallophosphoesterase [Thermodesulfobacteriota bacterium]